MHVPTPNKSVAYFAAHGCLLEKVPSQHEEFMWRFAYECGTTVHYQTLLAVWVSWMEYAQGVINEDRKLRDFMSAYRNADAVKQREMRRWTDEYWADPVGSRELSNFFEYSWNNSTDDLPRNWKTRLRKILSKPDGGSFFPYQVRIEIEALERSRQ